MGSELPKALVPLGSVPMLAHAASRLVDAGITDLVVTAPHGHVADVERLLFAAGITQARCLPGGQTRQQSVSLALDAISSRAEWVLVHDAARALAPVSLIRSVVDALLAGARAVIPGLAVVDTIKRVADGVVTGTPERSSLVAVQTPQGFSRSLLQHVHDLGAGLAGSEAAALSDDAGLVERFTDVPVEVVPGDERAIKITRPADLALAEAMLESGAWR